MEWLARAPMVAAFHKDKARGELRVRGRDGGGVVAACAAQPPHAVVVNPAHQYVRLRSQV